MRSIAVLDKLMKGEAKGPMPKDIKISVGDGYLLIEELHKIWMIPQAINGKKVVSSVQVYFSDDEAECDFYPIVSTIIDEDESDLSYIR